MVELTIRTNGSAIKAMSGTEAMSEMSEKTMACTYTQYVIIRNGLIRNSAEFLGKFKKRALGRSNLRNASKNLRNGQCSDFQS